jgi:hypothetical protein
MIDLAKSLGCVTQKNKIASLMSLLFTTRMVIPIVNRLFMLFMTLLEIISACQPFFSVYVYVVRKKVHYKDCVNNDEASWSDLL